MPVLHPGVDDLSRAAPVANGAGADREAEPAAPGGHPRQEQQAGRLLLDVDDLDADPPQRLLGQPQVLAE